MVKTDYEQAYRAHISRWGVGATLRGAREAGGETIQDVASALRIRAEYIHALEVEDFQRLPGWAYALSFVRTYGEYLGLEPLPLVKKVREQFELRQHMGPPPAVVARSRRGRRVTAGALAALALAVLVGGWFVAGPTISVAGMFDPLPRGLKNMIDQSFFTVAENDDAGSQPEILALGASAAMPPRDPVVTPRAAADIGIQTPRAPAQEVRPAAPPAPVRQVQLDVVGAPVGDTVVVGLHPRHSFDRASVAHGTGVMVRARGPVLVTIEDSAGAVVSAQQLNAGEVYRLPTGSGITMSADDAGALEVYVEGALAGLIGPAGQRVSRFPVDRLTTTRADG